MTMWSLTFFPSNISYSCTKNLSDDGKPLSDNPMYTGVKNIQKSCYIKFTEQNNLQKIS